VLLNKEADRTLSHLSPDFYSSFTVKWSFTGCKTSNIFQKIHNICSFSDIQNCISEQYSLVPMFKYPFH